MDKETFGQRLTRLRKQKGMTQEDVGSRLNITGQAVSKWENDISTPDITMLCSISELFDISLDELLGKESKNDTAVFSEEKKDINKMLLKIIVDSADGDKVRVNLPVAIIKICLESGLAIPQINGNDSLKNIDFTQILSLVEQGVIGKLVEIDSADGDKVTIVVE